VDGDDALPELVTSQAEIARIAEACAAAGALAIDLEFVSQDRYRPDLALVQVAWLGAGPGPEIRLLDPLAVDVAPLIELLAGAVDVIAHAPRQDLQILGLRFGVRARRVFDTQTAAAFAQLGDQVGYARLVEAVVAERLGKEAQWTNWLRRPLDPEQLHYAVDDVRHLHAIAADLGARLDGLGRRAWVMAESDAIAEVAYRVATLDPLDAWREIGAVRRLDPEGRAAARRLAAWRQEVADRDNKPPSWLISDRALVEVARERPRDERALRAMRLSEAARRHAGELLDALAAAAGDPTDELEVGPPPPSPGPRAQVWEEIVVALVQATSEDTGIPARYLATRGEAQELARALDARTDQRWDLVEHPLLAGWRRDLVGGEILEWLDGDAALIADPAATSGVRLAPRATGSR
jgi:ribonuclease D